MTIRLEELAFKDSPWEWSEGKVRNRKSGRQLPVQLAHLGGQRYQIWLAGQIFEVELAPSGPRRAGAAAAGSSQEHALKANMPGTILSLAVTVGQSVSAGQTLVVMESMKMELNLESPRDGKVAAVHVQAGQLVELGAVLLELEKS